MTTFADCLTLAYQRERVAARRLMRSAGLTEAQALAQVLGQVAGGAGLAQLVAQRVAALAALQAAAQQRRHSQQQRRMQQLQRQAVPSARHAWQAWFDGSSHPNPGKMGLGAVLHGPDGEHIALCMAAGHGDSNAAEYLALIAVLQAAVRVQADSLVLCGDSQVVLGDVVKARGTGARALAQYHAQAQDLLAQLGEVTLHWVARHRNTAADSLSQQAIALANGTARTTLTRAGVACARLAALWPEACA